MEIVIALSYHLMVALVDVFFKGRIKKKYNYDWSKVPDFWKSGKISTLLKWEPILFGTTYLLFLAGLFIFLGYTPEFLLIFTIYSILLGIVGTECILYWWIGSITGWEKAHWRMIQQPVTDFSSSKSCSSFATTLELPDKLHWFEIPPECPWLEKFPMVYMYWSWEANNYNIYCTVTLTITWLYIIHTVIKLLLK